MSAAMSGVPTNTSFLLRNAGSGIATRSIFSCLRMSVPMCERFLFFGDCGGSTGIA